MSKIITGQYLGREYKNYTENYELYGHNASNYCRNNVIIEETIRNSILDVITIEETQFNFREDGSNQNPILSLPKKERKTFMFC